MAFHPLNIRPRGEWAVLLAEPRRKTIGGLILTDQLTGEERVSEGAASVIRLGDSEKFKLIDLVEGARVLFRGFVKYAHPLENHDERWEDGEKKHYFLIKFDDICCQLDGDSNVGCYSGM